MGAECTTCREQCCVDDVPSISDMEDLHDRAARGAAVRTTRGYICFPTGVAADRLNRWGPHQSMRGLNAGVADMLIQRGAQETYAEFAAAIGDPIRRMTWPLPKSQAQHPTVSAVASPLRVGAFAQHGAVAPSDDDVVAEVARILQRYEPKFRRSGISAHYCVELKPENLGNALQDWTPSRWLLYVDRVAHPNYVVKQDALNSVVATSFAVMQDAEEVSATSPLSTDR